MNKEQISREIDAIKQGKQCTWGQICLLLDAIEKSGFWQEEARSFTSWVENNSGTFGVKSSRLWKILAAGRYSLKIRNQLTSHNISIAPLNELPNKVVPENIDLLSRLERVVPEEKFYTLARKVFEGEIKRAEMRSEWQLYRPILKGKTARGKGTPTPRVNADDPVQIKSLTEAIIVDSLKTTGPEWSGHENPNLYHVFSHVTPNDKMAKSKVPIFTAVAVIEPENGSPEYHGFCYPIHVMNGNLANDHSPLAYCDYLWIHPSLRTSSGKISTKLPSKLPHYIGIAEIEEGTVKVVQSAKHVEGRGELRDKLSSTLLTRSLKAS